MTKTKKYLLYFYIFISAWILLLWPVFVNAKEQTGYDDDGVQIPSDEFLMEYDERAKAEEICDVIDNDHGIFDKMELYSSDTDIQEWNRAFYRFFTEKKYLSTVSEQLSPERFTEYAFQFCFYDLDANGVPEMIMYNGGNGMVDMTNYVFAYDNGTIDYLGELGFRSSVMQYALNSGYPGVFWQSGNTGWYPVFYYTIKEGKLVSEEVLETVYPEPGVWENEYDEQITTDDKLFETYYKADETVTMYSRADIYIMGWDDFLSKYSYNSTIDGYGKKEGWCGDDVRWKYDDSILTIYGTGRMYDYDFITHGGDNNEDAIPWRMNRKDITRIIVEDGVTYLGINTFSSEAPVPDKFVYGKLRRIDIPVSVIEIGRFNRLVNTIYYHGTREQWGQVSINPNPYYDDITVICEGEEADSDKSVCVVIFQKIDVRNLFLQKYFKYTVIPNENATITNKGVITPKKSGTITVTGFNKVNGQWVPDADNVVSIKIEKPEFIEKTVTLNYPGAVMNARENLNEISSTPSKWLITNNKIATIDPNTGVVTAVKAGSVKVTAQFGEKKGQIAKYSFTVKVVFPVISKKSATMLTGATLDLKLNKAIGKPEWSSEDETIAEVNESGQVIAHSAGETVITASLDGIEYNCKIKVKKPTLSSKRLSLKAGNTKKLSLKNTKLTNVEWSSSDESIATIDDKGMITAVSKGTAEIKTTAGGCTDICVVVVK